MAQLTFPQTPFPVLPRNVLGAENPVSFSISDLPPAVRAAFAGFNTFNKVQVTVARAVLQTDDSLVVNAPTGSGKTVILELALVKLSVECAGKQFRAVYLAPTRSLCAEKYHDWSARFAALGISCIQYDGDNAVDDVRKLCHHQLILSTPEKWEVFTRHWGDQDVASVLRPIKLFLIDEIQVMDDGVRGATLELVVSRMKYIDSRMHREQLDGSGIPESLRYIAVSACIPNVDDFARWLKNERNVRPFSFAESYRTTEIGRHVVGFPYSTNPYKFELDLNYRLPAIIDEYSCLKPTLIFCSSRKSAETTANFLARSCMKRSLPSGAALAAMSSNLASKTLQDCVVKGVAFHHAGLLYADRSCVESHFRSGHLMVLCCTSTLCMGVNLPAYLVIIKSTFNYAGKDYSDSYILQMIGRAGRAEYNEKAVAVILTAEKNVERYRKLVSGTTPIESQLHHKLPELLNSEIVHGIIYDQPAVMEWVRSTFFYVRAQTNPGHYQFSRGRDIEDEIEKLCRNTIDSLEQSGLILKRSPNTIFSSACGKLMARNHLSFETMKLLQSEMKGTESLQEMLLLVTKAHEFCEYKCRNAEKRILNSLNVPTSGEASSEQKDEEPPEGVRFRWPGRISTTGAKVYCLVQAVFGNLTISDHGLHQEAAKIVTLGERISRCIVGLLDANGKQLRAGCFRALVSVSRLIQCFQSKLWEESPFLTKQLSHIGPKLARHLADNGKVTFQALRDSDPREIEWILKKQPPFGNEIIGYVSGLPQFTIGITKTLSTREGVDFAFSCTVTQRNVKYDPQAVPISFSVLVGDSANQLLLHRDNCTIESIELGSGGCTWPIYLKSTTSVVSLSAHLICLDWVGLDCSHTFYLFEPPVATKHKQTTITKFFPNHTLANDTMLSVDGFAIPSAQPMPIDENSTMVNESFGFSAQFKSISALNTNNVNFVTKSANISIPNLPFPNRNISVHGRSVENKVSIANESVEVSAPLVSAVGRTNLSSRRYSWNMDTTDIDHNTLMTLLQKPIEELVQNQPLLNGAAPILNTTVGKNASTLNGCLQVSAAFKAARKVPSTIGASYSLFSRPAVGQVLPIRSILKRPLPSVRDSCNFNGTLLTLQEQAQTTLNSSKNPKTEDKPTGNPPLRGRKNARPYFSSDEFKDMFRQQKCTQFFTFCSPSEDIVDCFRRYNMFMPLTGTKRTWHSALEETRNKSKSSLNGLALRGEHSVEAEIPVRKKNFDLGSAEHVICVDDSD